VAATPEDSKAKRTEDNPMGMKERSICPYMGVSVVPVQSKLSLGDKQGMQFTPVFHGCIKKACALWYSCKANPENE